MAVILGNYLIIRGFIICEKDKAYYKHYTHTWFYSQSSFRIRDAMHREQCFYNLSYAKKKRFWKQYLRRSFSKR